MSDLSVIEGSCQLSSVESVKLFLSPDGDDSNTGLSLESPLLTLQAAETIIKNLISQKLSPSDADCKLKIRVLIAPGRYPNQTVAWTTVDRRAQIIFEGAIDNDGNGPVFLGSTMNHSSTQRSGNDFFSIAGNGFAPIVIRNLVINGYQNGISLYGRNGRTIHGIHIVQNQFQNIGNGGNNPSYWCPGFAAIKFRRSFGNEISKNTFENIENRPWNTSMGLNCIGSKFSVDPNHDLLLVHHLYFYDSSSSNVVSGNRFESASGHLIKFRHASNDNVIEKNTFASNTYNQPLFQDYYDHLQQECENYGNRAKGNSLLAAFTLLSEIKIWKLNPACIASRMQNSNSLDRGVVFAD